MIIDINILKEQGLLKLNHVYNPTDEDLNFDDFQFKGLIELVGEARLEADYLLVDVVLQAKVNQECGRCLESFDNDFSETLSFGREVTGTNPIDITSEVREVVLLAHPMSFSMPLDENDKCTGCSRSVADILKLDNKVEMDESEFSKFAQLKKLKEKFDQDGDS